MSVDDDGALVEALDAVPVEADDEEMSPAPADADRAPTPAPAADDQVQEMSIDDDDALVEALESVEDVFGTNVSNRVTLDNVTLDNFGDTFTALYLPATTRRDPHLEPDPAVATADPVADTVTSAPATDDPESESDSSQIDLEVEALINAAPQIVFDDSKGEVTRNAGNSDRTGIFKESLSNIDNRPIHMTASIDQLPNQVNEEGLGDVEQVNEEGLGDLEQDELGDQATPPLPKSVYMLLESLPDLFY